MAHFKLLAPLNVPLMLLKPVYADQYGVANKTFPSLENGVLIYGNFRTYGGTERDVNGLYSIEDTAVVETWYRPDILSDCRIGVISTGAVYEIINEPENINLRNQYLRFKVKRVKGGA